jgi:hypothetical protein
MKKQKFLLSTLQLKKVNIAKLNLLGGLELPDSQLTIEDTLKTNCCTQYPYCLHTLTTRPHSINPGGHQATTESGE